MKKDIIDSSAIETNEFLKVMRHLFLLSIQSNSFVSLKQQLQSLVDFSIRTLERNVKVEGCVCF